jgi:hypothetical protein
VQLSACLNLNQFIPQHDLVHGFASLITNERASIYNAKPSHQIAGGIMRKSLLVIVSMSTVLVSGVALADGSVNPRLPRIVGTLADGSVNPRLPRIVETLADGSVNPRLPRIVETLADGSVNPRLPRITTNTALA